MKKPVIKTSALWWAAIVLLCFSKQSAAQTSTPAFDPALAAQLQGVLDEARLSQRLRGLSAAVIVPGHGSWQGVSGLSGPMASDVVKPDLRFAIASIKKTFVAALILQLAEEGALSLDDSLSHWVPNARFIDPAITLRHLLSHTSGIYNYTDHPVFWSTLWGNVEKVWTPEEVLDNFVSLPVFAPGSRFAYSNTNYLLLSMVIRAATGSSVSAQYRDRFWGRLNLTGTFLAAEEDIVGDIAHLWADRNGDGWLDDIHDAVGPSMYTLLWPFVFSTAEDLAKWAEALYGGQVLDAASMEAMLTFTPVNFNPYWRGYGLGAMHYRFDGEELWGHGGLLPGLRSIMAYAPATGVSLSVLVNQEDFDSVYRIAPSLYSTVKDFLSTYVSSESSREEPAPIALHPTYPNPFSQRTVIAFDLPHAASVTLDVFDLYGRKLATLADGPYGPGSHRITWRAEGLASGVYLYRLQAGAYAAVRRVLLMR